MGPELTGEIPPVLFTENQTNNQRLYGIANSSLYTKDAFHRYVIHRDESAVNRKHVGTKAAAHYVLRIPPGNPSGCDCAS